MKPSSRRSGESSSARSGGTIVTWLQKQEKFVDALRLRALQRQRGRGRGRLEADREEDDLAVGVLAARSAARRAASRPSARRRPRAFASSSVPSRARDAQHVAEAGEDHAGLVRDRDPVVDAAHRDHADRAARAVHELDVRRAAGRRRRTCRSSACGRRRPPSPCSGGPARPSARISPASARPSSASRNSSTNLMRAASSTRQRDAGVHEHARRRRATGADEPMSTVLPRAVGVLADARARARASTLDDAHRHALVPAGDAVLVRAAVGGRGRGGHRSSSLGRSLDHARLQLLELLLVVGAHLLEQLRRRERLLLVDLRDREADVDQDPVARARVTPPSPSSRPMLTLRRTPATSTFARRFASSTISTIWPGWPGTSGSLPRASLPSARGSRSLGPPPSTPARVYSTRRAYPATVPGQLRRGCRPAGSAVRPAAGPPASAPWVRPRVLEQGDHASVPRRSRGCRRARSRPSAATDRDTGACAARP